METLNRMGIIVRRRQPYVDWANSFDDGVPQFDSAEHSPNVYLINEVRDPRNVRQALQRWWREIFEEELSAWIRDPDDWPEHLTLSLFLQWFEVEIVEIVSDLGTDPILDP